MVREGDNRERERYMWKERERDIIYLHTLLDIAVPRAQRVSNYAACLRSLSTLQLASSIPPLRVRLLIAALSLFIKLFRGKSR